MSDNAIRILIQSNPLWQQQVPVHVRTIYTVMGRQGKLWQTILSATEDVYAARSTMDAANNSGLFDRVVIAEGRSVNKAPAAHWQTIECAVPVRMISDQSEFERLLNTLQDKTANMDTDAYTYATPIVGTKETCNFALTIALVLAGLHTSPILLTLVAFFCFVDVLFLSDAKQISSATAKKYNTLRHWGYALFNGILLLPLLLKILM